MLNKVTILKKVNNNTVEVILGKQGQYFVFHSSSLNSLNGNKEFVTFSDTNEKYIRYLFKHAENAVNKIE